MKPLFVFALTFLVVSLCECIPAGAGEPPPKPGQSPFKDCATDCPEMVVIPAGRSLAKECGVGTGTVQRIAREMAEVSRPLAGGGAAA
jgi:hypothetical protein